MHKPDLRLPPPCTDDDSSTGPCGPAALCLQCKKTARTILDQAAVGHWDTVMQALVAWPKLVNYAPEFEEGHKTLVSVATPLYEGGPAKAHRTSAPAPHPHRTRTAPAPHRLCTGSARTPFLFRRPSPRGPTAKGSRRGAGRLCCSRTTCKARPRRHRGGWTRRARMRSGRSGATTRCCTGRCLQHGAKGGRRTGHATLPGRHARLCSALSGSREARFGLQAALHWPSAQASPHGWLCSCREGRPPP